MAISIKNNNLPPSAYINKIDTVKYNLPMADNQNAFNSLLRDYLKETGTSASSGAALPSLDKDQVALLVKNIQIQMNRQLFNAVFNNGGDINFYPSRILPSYTNETTPSLENVSKNRQEPPKKEVNKGSFNKNSFNETHLMPRKEVNQGSFNLDDIIARAARKYEVDPDLIRSVIKAESNFDPRATSSKGAMGLMQLMPETARDLGVKNAYDPEENIMGGTRYLKSLLGRYNGKTEPALAAYNWGMGNVERNSQRLPKETSTYIARVNGYYKNLKESV